MPYPVIEYVKRNLFITTGHKAVISQYELFIDQNTRDYLSAYVKHKYCIGNSLQCGYIALTIVDKIYDNIYIGITSVKSFGQIQNTQTTA